MSQEIKTTIDKQMFGMDLNTVKALAVIIAAIVYGYSDFKNRIEKLEQAPAAVRVLESKQVETDKSIISIQTQMKQIQESFNKTTEMLDTIRNTTDTIQKRMDYLTQRQLGASGGSNQDQNSFTPQPRR
jgi:septal ring factor EnvC (AmiA/AmiB activator)